MTSTHTNALLKVTPATHAEVLAKFKAAGYDHAIDVDGSIDMNGVALVPTEPTEDHRELAVKIAREEAFNADPRPSYVTGKPSEWMPHEWVIVALMRAAGAKPRDPYDGVKLPPKGASREETAMAFYEVAGAMMAALAAKADDTVAKNYVAVIFDGFKLPFDRGEIHLMRPGGLTPTQRAEALQARCDDLWGQVGRLAIANTEIASELTNHLAGDVNIECEERFDEAVKGRTAALMALREAHLKLNTESALAVKAAREAIEAGADPKTAIGILDGIIAKLGAAL